MSGFVWEDDFPQTQAAQPVDTGFVWADDFSAPAAPTLPTFSESGFTWDNEISSTPDSQQSIISGESWFEKFMDAINTPQQALFGLMTSKPEEDFLSAMERGMRENVSGKDVTGEGISGTVAQFVLDPINLIPASWGKALVKPVGALGSMVIGPAGELLGRSKTWVNLAQKFSKTAYRDADEMGIIDRIDQALEQMDIKVDDILQDQVGQMKAVSKTIADTMGRSPEFIEKTIRQAAEDKRIMMIGEQEGVKAFAWAEDMRPVLDKELAESWAEIMAIDNTMPLKLPSSVMKAVTDLKTANDEILFIEQKLGAGTPALQDLEVDYLFHMTSPAAKEAIGKAFEARFGYRQWAPAHASMLARAPELKGLKIDEINKLNELGQLEIGGVKIQVPGKFFEDDLDTIMAFRRMRTARLETTINMLKSAADDLGFDASDLREEIRGILDDPAIAGKLGEGSLEALVKERIPNGWAPLAFTRSDDARYAGLKEVFKDQYFKPEIAKHLNAMMQFTVDPNAAGGMMKLIENIRANWVTATMYAPPGALPTLTKNQVGNVINNSLAGLNNPLWYKDAVKFQHLVGTKKFGTMKFMGNEIDVRDFHQELKNMGVYHGGQATKEIAAFKTKFGRDPAIMRIPGVGNILRRTQSWYRMTEENARIALYAYKRFGPEGLSPMAARAEVKKYLFDYVYGLTDFEKKIRNFIPFYAWTRFNVPLQIRSLIEKGPLRWPYIPLAQFTSLVRDNEAARNVDDFHKTVLPQFVREQAGVPYRTGEDGNPEYLLFGSWVPTAEIEQLLSPRGILRKAMNMVAPFLKEPIEQTLNVDSFLQRKIEDYPGETQRYLGLDVRRRLVHLARLFRFANDMDKILGGSQDVTKPEKDAWSKAARALFGGGTYRVNLEYGESKRQREINRIISKMKYEDNESNLEALEQYLEELTEE